ncbi:hypothetical protein [Rhodopseudomonas parapalustris]
MIDLFHRKPVADLPASMWLSGSGCPDLGAETADVLQFKLRSNDTYRAVRRDPRGLRPAITEERQPRIRRVRPDPQIGDNV